MKLIYFWIFLLSLLSLSTTRADDAEFAGEGETVWPIENKEIEMVAETVMVRPGKAGWYANCIFILRNTVEATEIQIGFPDMTDEGPGADTSKGTIQNFRCFVDGNEVAVEHKRGVQNPLNPDLKYHFAFIWRTFFERGQIRRLTNSYSFRGVGISDGSLELWYVLQTGSLWKGTIKNAFIEFDLGKYDPRLFYSIEPPGYTIEKK